MGYFCPSGQSSATPVQLGQISLQWIIACNAMIILYIDDLFNLIKILSEYTL